MEKDWLLWIQNAMPDRVLETNKTTEKYGLSLTREEAGIILKEQERILKEQRRIDLNGGAAEKSSWNSAILISSTRKIMRKP